MNDYEKWNGFSITKYNEAWIYNIIQTDTPLRQNDWIHTQKKMINHTWTKYTLQDKILPGACRFKVSRYSTNTSYSLIKTKGVSTVHASAWPLPHTPTDFDFRVVLNRNKASAMQNVTSFKTRHLFKTYI